MTELITGVTSFKNNRIAEGHLCPSRRKTCPFKLPRAAVCAEDAWRIPAKYRDPDPVRPTLWSRHSVDDGVAEGGEVSMHYDLLAKL